MPKWAFPVFEPTDEFDPANVKRHSARRSRSRASMPNKPPEAEWTAERFAIELGSDEPQTRQTLIDAAIGRGLSERQAVRLVRGADKAGHLFRWSAGANKPIRYAKKAPPEDP